MRIKTVYTDSLKFETHAVYYLNGRFYDDANITADDCVSYTMSYDNDNTPIIGTLKPGDSYEEGKVYQTGGHRYLCLKTTTITDINSTVWKLYDYEFDINYETFAEKNGALNYKPFTVTYNGSKWKMEGTTFDFS